jgi:hypothetical protein
MLVLWTSDFLKAVNVITCFYKACFVNRSTGTREALIMETEEKVKEKKDDECVIDDKDTDKKTNLCCCYVVDPCGCYVDPCFKPGFISPGSSCCC